MLTDDRSTARYASAPRPTAAFRAGVDADAGAALGRRDISVGEFYEKAAGGQVIFT
jgi:hypothetical protein